MPELPPVLSLFLPLAEETERLGALLAGLAAPGDTILLDGPVGSGKTHLARAFIRARLAREEDVPSPTFTLVQTYGDGADEIWHTDLYRLSHPDEALELGLEDAFGRVLCLVEWPDRLGRHVPDDALRLRFVSEGEGRRVFLEGGANWGGRLDRLAEQSNG
jgi:tRNA threonylcarbamoyladenosine biosynthesis protein TsaE